MDTVQFDPAAHTYTVNGCRYRSVSQLIATLKPPFDVEAAAVRVAKRKGIPVDDVLERWLNKCQSACDTGHELHSFIQGVITGKPVASDLPTAKQFSLWWDSAKAHLAWHSVERIIYRHKWQLAGTADLIAASKKTNLYHVFDWKQNGEFNALNRWQKLLPPFDDLDDCHLSIYSIQVWCYTLMLESLGMPEIGAPWIIHFSNTRARPYKALPIRDRVLQWLETTV